MKNSFSPPASKHNIKNRLPFRAAYFVLYSRHQLTEHLYQAGGHIGYGIRPSARLRGYAAKLLELSLIEAKKLGINDVLVVCDAGNVGSERTIIKNGGKPDTDYIEEDGNVVKRYWIKILDSSDPATRLLENNRSNKSGRCHRYPLPDYFMQHCGSIKV